MPLGFISGGPLFLYNFGMEELLKRLEEIGLPAAEIERVKRYYANDIDGLSEYVLYMKAMFDDRHEYV
jgi:hypothetical protein